MISGTGVDIVEISRMEDAIKKWGEAFLIKIFTPREIAYSSSKRFSHQHFAARFAAKEAVMKAFGDPLKHPLSWTEIEVLNDKEGKPTIEFHKGALAVKNKKNISEVIVSLSHSKDYAIANAILLKK